MAEHAGVRHGVNSARACLMSQSCERYDHMRCNGTADWLGIKVDVSLPSAFRFLCQTVAKTCSMRLGVRR
jgi:hypothetical protein